MKKLSPERILHSLEVLVLAATLVVTVTIAARVYDQAQNHFAKQRTSDFVARHNQGEVRKLRASFESWRSSDETPKALLARAERDAAAKQTVADIRDYANFFQELAAAYYFDSLDKGYLKKLFQSRIVAAVKELEPFIIACREQPGKSGAWQDAFDLRAEFSR